MKKISFRQKTALITAGILMGILFLEAGLRLGGLAILSLREARNIMPRGARDEYRVLCIGESTTYDGGIYCYPRQLETILNDEGTDVKFKVINNGIPGITTSTIVEELGDNLDKYKPDLVIVMMGVNDSDNIVTDKIIPDKEKGLSLKRLRVYRLARLLQLNIISRLKESGICGKKTVKRNACAPEKEPGGKYTSEEKEKIAMLKGEIEKNPANCFARFALAKYYKQKEDFGKIEAMYRDLIEKNQPGNDRERVYADLTRFYQEHGRFDDIERMYKEGIKKTPDSVRLYCELGIHYRDRARYEEAERMYKKALGIEPQNSIIYDNLGDCYKKQGRDEDAERMYAKARELHPEHINTHYELLGKEVREIGNYPVIEEMYEKILEIDPDDAEACMQLGRIYEKQGKYDDAENIYKKLAQITPNRYEAYGLLARYYKKRGQDSLGKIYSEKTDTIRGKNYYAFDIGDNYRRLKEIVIEKGLDLVCVQYPVWDVEPLKKILGLDQKVLFVDNKRIFEDAVEKEGYDAYFIDHFAGDFGHCTRKGNRLLAQNIANAILKKFFIEQKR